MPVLLLQNDDGSGHILRDVDDDRTTVYDLRPEGQILLNVYGLRSAAESILKRLRSSGAPPDPASGQPKVKKMEDPATGAAGRSAAFLGVDPCRDQRRTSRGCRP